MLILRELIPRDDDLRETEYVHVFEHTPALPKWQALQTRQFMQNIEADAYCMSELKNNWEVIDKENILKELLRP